MIRSERGYATIVAAGIIVAISAVLIGVATVAATRIDTKKAQVIADFSAVAGAFSLAYGDDGCTRARETAQLNQAHLDHCLVESSDVVVYVTKSRGQAIARAGPL